MSAAAAAASAGAGAAAAARLVRERQKMLQLFREEGAIRRDRAIAYEAQGKLAQNLLRQLVKRDIIRQTNNKFWLDEKALEQRQQHEKRIVRYILLGMFVAIIILAGIIYVLVV